MAADDHLSPNQFAEHAGFEKWTRDQEKTLQAQHTTVLPSGVRHASFPPDAGKRMAQLRSSREMLLDFASMDYYSKTQAEDHSMGMLKTPLHELLPENYHHLVDEYRSGR